MSNTATNDYVAFARTIPARRMARSFGRVVRLPAPIFERITLSVPVPPPMPTRSLDGVMHASPALAIEWTHTINVLRGIKS